MENQNYNSNGPFQQNNMDPNQNPYSLDNPYYSKTQFREMLINMSQAQRESFIASLPQDFANSSRMPSLKNKVTLILLAIFLGGLGVDRFYRGKIGTGILKLLMPTLSFIAILVAYSSILRAALNPETITVDTWPIAGIIFLFIFVILVFASVIWQITDIVIAAVGKAKDKSGRKIDV